MIEILDRDFPDDLPEPLPELGPTPEQIALRESGIAKLVAGQPLTEEEAKAVAGG